MPLYLSRCLAITSWCWTPPWTTTRVPMLTRSPSISRGTSLLLSPYDSPLEQASTTVILWMRNSKSPSSTSWRPQPMSAKVCSLLLLPMAIDIGYCQSMNFLAAFLLRYMTEEQAFYTLICIYTTLLPDYWVKNLVCAYQQEGCVDWSSSGWTSVRRVVE